MPKPRDTSLEDEFLLYWNMVYAHKTQALPPIEREVENVIPGRNFRFDFGWPEGGVLVDIQGGTWRAGRHTRHDGYSNDRFKSNWAQLEGFFVLEFTTDWFKGKIIYGGRGKKKTIVERRDPETMIDFVITCYHIKNPPLTE